MIDLPDSFGRTAVNDARIENHIRRRAHAQPVLVGKRQKKQIARDDLMPCAARGLNHALALRHQMKDADVAEMRHRHALVIALGRDQPERRGEAGTEKDRAGQAHGPQHL